MDTIRGFKPSIQQLNLGMCMFHTIADFTALWQEEAKNTEKLLTTLSDESLNRQLVPGLRTIKQLVRHILESPGEMLGRTGLKIAGAENLPQATSSVEEIVEAHRKVAHSVAHQIQLHWNNKTLHQTDDMYGEMWTRSQTLTALLFHLIHHRGQLTVLMRIAGLKVAGMYGPSKEEWTAYGMQAPVEE
jgi:uncharacterized damage-inducible protein DinB